MKDQNKKRKDSVQDRNTEQQTKKNVNSATHKTGIPRTNARY